MGLFFGEGGRGPEREGSDMSCLTNCACTSLSRGSEISRTKQRIGQRTKAPWSIGTCTRGIYYLFVTAVLSAGNNEALHECIVHGA